jgi:hypothetical protein
MQPLQEAAAGHLQGLQMTAIQRAAAAAGAVMCHQVFQCIQLHTSMDEALQQCMDRVTFVSCQS